jgi:hypothetical protein
MAGNGGRSGGCTFGTGGGFVPLVGVTSGMGGSVPAPGLRFAGGLILGDGAGRLAGAGFAGGTAGTVGPNPLAGVIVGGSITGGMGSLGGSAEGSSGAELGWGERGSAGSWVTVGAGNGAEAVGWVPVAWGERSRRMTVSSFGQSVLTGGGDADRWGSTQRTTATPAATLSRAKAAITAGFLPHRAHPAAEVARGGVVVVAVGESAVASVPVGGGVSGVSVAAIGSPSTAAFPGVRGMLTAGLAAGRAADTATADAVGGKGDGVERENAGLPGTSTAIGSVILDPQKSPSVSCLHPSVNRCATRSLALRARGLR